MRVSAFLSFSTASKTSELIKAVRKLPIVQIQNATFFKRYPLPDDVSNPAWFPDLAFSIPSDPSTSEPERWAIISRSSTAKTTFLEVLQGQHFCVPPTARSYPYLSSPTVNLHNSYTTLPARAIQYVGFYSKSGALGDSGSKGAYLSARYESRRESTDFSLRDYLEGNVSLNPSEELFQRGEKGRQQRTFDDVTLRLNLASLLELPVGNLSNGQSCRARIAKALMAKPEILLLDEPFMGLDPPTIDMISEFLDYLACKSDPRIILALRPQDPLPEWVTHIVYLDLEGHVALKGERTEVMKALPTWLRPSLLHLKKRELKLEAEAVDEVPTLQPSIDPQISAPLDQRGDTLEEKYAGQAPQRQMDLSLLNIQPESSNEAIVEMNGVKVQYGDRQVLGSWQQIVDGEPKHGLWWTVSRGQRWGIFGPNGSGKTTILSLICSDHPQTYSLPIKLFGQSRLPTPGRPGKSIFDIQSNIGHSSPEVHAFFPRNVTVRQTIENAWANTFRGKPMLTHENDVVIDACLRWFEYELNPQASSTDAIDILQQQKLQKEPLSAWSKAKLQRLLDKYTDRDVDWADSLLFGELSTGAQRVALLLRALIKKPDLVILDEAFSGMDSYTRDKCMTFLAHGEKIILSPPTGARQLPKHQLPTALAQAGRIVISGLEKRQALICISHVKEEVPSVVTDWMCLPEPNEGKPVRFGRTDKSRTDNTWWNEIWNV